MMMSAMRRARTIACVAAVAAAPVAVVSVQAADDGRLVVKGDLVFTATGSPIEDGVIVIESGRIVSVGPASDVAIPEGVPVVSAAVVTPGLIDARSVVGLSGIYNQRHDQDQLERSEPIQPELRAIDAFNSDEPLLGWIRSFGVTTIHTGHAPGQLVSGQTMIVKTWSPPERDGVLRAEAMVAATLGEGAVVFDPDRKGPGTRSKAVALLRQELLAAAAYGARREDPEGDARPERNLRNEALVRVLAGELPLLVTAERHHDIRAALRLAEEFDLRLVLDGAAESYVVLEEIVQAGVPVIVHATMKRAVGETENLSFETAGILADAGILMAIESGYESYVPKTRVVLFEAAVASAHGLGRERALESITIGAARLLGIDDRVGSLELGKDGDVALYDGDPFEYTTHCVGVVVDGVLVEDEPH